MNLKTRYANVSNYIKLADLRKAGFEVGYDEKNKLPIISNIKM